MKHGTNLKLAFSSSHTSLEEEREVSYKTVSKTFLLILCVRGIAKDAPRNFLSIQRHCVGNSQKRLSQHQSQSGKIWMC
jgi:hypothetical protein